MTESDVPTPRWQPRATLETTAYGVVILACVWWLLGQWADVLRPLLLAIFLAYVTLPWYSRLRRNGMPTPVAIVGLAGMVTVILISTVQIAYVNLSDLQAELPTLQARTNSLMDESIDWLRTMVPGLPMLHGTAGIADRVNSLAAGAASATAGGLIEAATTALYLLFLLLGAERLPGRVREAYPGPRGDRILHIAGKINSAIISYLRAKVISSAILAIGAGIVLAVFGVKFVAIWMLLTFLCNFIPYVGSVISFTLPTAYAALQLPPWGGPIGVALGLLAAQVISATLIEPMLIGHAVGLSPLLILAALAVWGSVWGIPGMFLAVPLTVVLRIVLSNIEETQPLARLAEE